MIASFFCTWLNCKKCMFVNFIFLYILPCMRDPSLYIIWIKVINQLTNTYFNVSQKGLKIVTVVILFAAVNWLFHNIISAKSGCKFFIFCTMITSDVNGYLTRTLQKALLQPY